jgi:hypothetical protein
MDYLLLLFSLIWRRHHYRHTGGSEESILTQILMGLNPIEDYLYDSNISYLIIITEGIGEELVLYIKMLILFYADDTAVLAEYVNDLHEVYYGSLL